jgi:Fe-S oxidoreductase
MEKDLPIIVLEPSCYSTLKDDYPDLLEDAGAARRIADRIVTLEEFLTGEPAASRLAEHLRKGPAKVLFHGHCQQKALTGSGALNSVLHQLQESNVQEVPSGCCGMAGSFGYEKEHYALSRKIGERHLLPAVRDSNPETEIVVPGFSCRSQVEHFTGQKTHHLAEIIARYLKAPN